jgi:RNA polymerase sigma-70 factor (ECF subfamily)
MRSSDPKTEELLRTAGAGDESAVRTLLSRYRARLRRMVAVRLDPRLSRRVDASDVVQEALADAGEKLPGFLRDRPLPFLPWLKRLALERVARTHRHHVRSSRRAVGREATGPPPRPEGSVEDLHPVDGLIDRGPDPGEAADREEQRRQVAAALQRLGPRDREVLALRYLDHLSFAEVAAALGLGLGAVKMRHLRALDRLRALLDEESGGDGEGPG